MLAKKYLDKYGFHPRFIQKPIHPDTEIVVAIPCYNEGSITSCLASLKDCIPGSFVSEVIVLFNASEEDSAEVKEINLQCYGKAEEWIKSNDIKQLNIHLHLLEDLPKKIAGVGLARKIAMDEAVRRFADINKEGIIVGFDADSQVDPNYLVEIQAYFRSEQKSPGCSIYFEHPIAGDHFEQKIYTGILNYELHLRYYNQAFRYTGHPHAFHTVGSSFAVRSSAYMKQGGMNKRKAGEDFYFIQKIIGLGEYGELNSTRVIPSPRPSDRVPFGTGRAILSWMDDSKDSYSSYSFKSFECLRSFFQLIPEFYLNRGNIHLVIDQIPNELKRFLQNYFFEERIAEISSNTSNINSFRKRFFHWFNAFMILKFVHYYRDQFEGLQAVEDVSFELLKRLQIHSSKEPRQLLEDYRNLEKKTPVL